MSTNGGTSFSGTLLADALTGRFINPADYDDNLHILYSVKGAGTLYRVKNITTTPTAAQTVTITGMTDWASLICVSPYTVASTTLFLGTEAGKLFKVTNADATPVITDITGSSFPVGSISCVEVGVNENELLVTFFNYGVISVWYTSDGGTSWVNKEGNLPDMPVRWALFNPSNRSEVLLATELGVWSSTDFTNVTPTWATSNSGLANVRVDMLQIRSSDKQVIAATHGRGLFSSNGFSPPCVAPTVQASNITFSNISSNQIDVSWTNGNGDRRMVYMNTTNSFTPPTNGTEPVANSVYSGSGAQLVYNGSSNSFSAAGLLPNVTYYFRIYEANCSGIYAFYQTASATNNPNIQLTVYQRINEKFSSVLAPSGWTLSNTSNLLSWSSSINGYNSLANIGCVKADNYNIVNGSIGTLDTRSFYPTESGDSLRFDIAAKGYNSSSLDSLSVLAYNGTSFAILRAWKTSMVVDTGISTLAASTSQYTSTLSTDWRTKKIALPVGTTKIQFRWKSAYGNSIYLDNIMIDSIIPPNNFTNGGGNNLFSNALNWSLGAPNGNTPLVVSSNNLILDTDYTVSYGKTFTLSGTSSLTINPSRTLTIAGTANFGGRLVTIKSDATGTGAIGTITGTLTNATNVTTERYITNSGRRNRFLSSPITSKTISDWMTQFYVTGPGDGASTTPPNTLGGTMSTGWVAAKSNIDFPGSYHAVSNPFGVRYTSIRTYNESDTGSLDFGFTNVNTNTTLNAGKGFKAFIRGAIGDTGQLNGNTIAQSAITLSLNGTVNQGEINSNITYTSTSTAANDGWNLLGNPYPSAYDFNAQYDAANSLNMSNLNPTIYVYSGVAGSYTSFNALSNMSAGLTSGVIPSGSGFFVHANNSNPIFKFEEVYKTSNVNPPLLHKTGIDNNELGIKFYKDSTESDYYVLKILAGATINYDMYDIKKFRNDNINLASYGNDSIQLTGSCIPPFTGETRIKLQVEATQKGTYHFDFTNITNFSERASLFDKYLNKNIDLKKENNYTFDLDQNVNQWTKNRFELVLNQEISSQITTPNFDNNIILSIYPNPATDKLNISIKNASLKNAMITIYDVSGAEVMNNMMKENTTELDIEKLKKGIYILNITNKNGFDKTVKFVK